MSKCKNGIKIIVFFLIIILCFQWVDQVFTAKDEEKFSADYYTYAEDTFDVVFLGPSVMKDAIQPVQLYEDYGIASYNLSCGNQSLASSYYILQNAIEKDSPDLVVLDITYAEEIFIVRGNNSIHYVTDEMPYTNKWRNQLIELLLDEEDRLEYYFPFYRFHTRWKELTASDLANEDYQDITLGSKVSGKTMPWSSVLFTRYETDTELGEIPREYFEKIIALCQENDIELLLTCLPIVAATTGITDTTYSQRLDVMEDVAVIAAANDIPFLNFLANPDALLLDYYSDFQDGVHLNIYGAEKFTDFMGLYITSNYEIEDRREDESFARKMEKILPEYEELIRTKSFSTASRTDTYLEVVADYMEDDDVLVLICSQLLQGTAMSDSMREGLTALGLGGDFETEDLTNYYAVLCKGELLAEEQTHFTDDLTCEMTIEGIRIELTTNSMSEDDAPAEVVIRGADVAPADTEGIYIAVYDMDDKTLLDCAALSFDGSTITHFEEAGD